MLGKDLQNARRETDGVTRSKTQSPPPPAQRIRGFPTFGGRRSNEAPRWIRRIRVAV